MTHELSRREVIAGTGAIASMSMLSGLFASSAEATQWGRTPGEETMKMLSGLFGSNAEAAEAKDPAKGPYVHKLPQLPYPEDALDPVIDKMTVNIHFNKHFGGYIEGLNATVAKLQQARKSGDYAAIKALSRDLAFNGSGVVLHYIYFMTIGPNAGGPPTGKIGDQINKDFGSFDTFWQQFAAASKAVEASGWGVLAWEPFSRCLVVMQAEKHQNLTSWGALPIMVCDVWEHAYYLKYHNRRAEYVDNFKKIIDWKSVEKIFQQFCVAR